MPQNEYSRPATLNDLKKVIRSLNEHRAEYILIGGYALFSHGYHRATEDIDLLVPAKSSASGKIMDALLILADKESANLDPEWFNEGENIRLADEVVVDLIFKTCGETFETLKPYVETVDLDGIAVHTLSLTGLLKTKQSTRDKDVMDRVILERAVAALRNQDDTSS
jgi:predicted nucleotidyltransferase